ncbi:hypothetical protein ACOSQ3_032095 [Xanthoceras sorbifolium]
MHGHSGICRCWQQDPMLVSRILRFKFNGFFMMVTVFCSWDVAYVLSLEHSSEFGYRYAHKQLLGWHGYDLSALTEIHFMVPSCRCQHEGTLRDWVHVKLKQIVCSFLVRDTGIDWLMGAEWFETCLLDYDPCSNYGNWTYGAGESIIPTSPSSRICRLRTLFCIMCAHYVCKLTVRMTWVPTNRAGTVPVISLDFRKWRPETSKTSL